MSWNETEDGMGFAGLVPTKAELKAEREESARVSKYMDICEELSAKLAKAESERDVYKTLYQAGKRYAVQWAFLDNSMKLLAAALKEIPEQYADGEPSQLHFEISTLLARVDFAQQKPQI